MNHVILLSGTCGSGKSTISALLGTVGWFRISEDDFWHEQFGRQRGKFGTDEHRRKRQQIHEAVSAAVFHAFDEELRPVVIDATVHESPPEAFFEYRAWFEGQHIPWVLRVLHPTLEVAIARDALREGWHAGRDRVSSLHAKFTGFVFSPECFIDTSHDTPEDTLWRLLTDVRNARFA
ncbi:MAG: ATP-binding protein [Acidobacteriota bacterium]|nr:ATP-binding protein [Acidobacteriota bacterium]